MPVTTKDLKLSRLKLRSDQLVEIHLAELPVPPERMAKLPGVQEWFMQMKLLRERDQQALHRMLNQINGAVAGVAAAKPAEKGDKGDKGEKGDKGDKGDIGPAGEGDVVLTWMNL